MKPLNQLTVLESRDLLVKKEISSVELTTACLDAIEIQDTKLHAFVTVFRDDALDAAKRVDKEGITKPLSGIPLGIKDNFLTFGQRTTASSSVLDQFMPPYESTVTNKLKEAGAVITGKTNMDAWAHGSSTETSDYGPTLNPHDLSKLAGGSSGGSAAAVSADEVVAAIGSETAGSIRQPASWCGVIGMKPTYGRVSRYGVVAMGSSLDSPGPLTKTVADASFLLSIIAGHDPHDATTSSLSVPDYLKELSAKVTSLRIGLPKEYFMSKTQPGINELVKKAAKQCEKLGATLIPVNLLDPKYSIADYTIIQRSEVSSNLSRYDGIRYGHDRAFFGDEAKRRIMLGTYALSSGYYDAYYKKAESVRELLKQDFSRVFESVEVILAPTSPSTAMTVGSTLNQSMFGELADVLIEASSLTGHPGINIPIGSIGGLPVGAQFIAPHFHEQTVLNIAYAYEQSINWEENKL
ncbi:MAG: Glutamyl-tRNA(Gln) amidotransferase subunit A [Microgenomates group bacterium GW2011_GWC2_46_7]|nr:MAG: Glutamyl-tRNA(Gln) amidotransferase subunit A [Microgenomates group bacterium GW2011_GWC2_46_7]